MRIMIIIIMIVIMIVVVIIIVIIIIKINGLCTAVHYVFSIWFIVRQLPVKNMRCTGKDRLQA